MQESRLIIYIRIEELKKKIALMEKQVYAASSNRMKEIYRRKLSSLVAAKMLNDAIYYGTGEIQ